MSARSFPVVSRRAVQKLQSAKEAGAQKKKGPTSTADEKPWPKSVVFGFFGSMAIVVPYTAGWFLAQHGPLRDQIVELIGLQDDHAVLQWMRRTFGTVDWQQHPDNHNGLIKQQEREKKEVHHKMEDEPTLAVRRQQGYIQKRNDEIVNVRVLTYTGASFSDELREFPCRTLATVESFGRMVALEFPDDGEEEEEVITDDLDTSNASLLSSGSDGIQMAIYSPWHHHVVPEPFLQKKKQPQANEVGLELDRLEGQIKSLEAAIQRGQSVDDVQDELQRLRSEHRKLRFRQYFW